ncbi:MAG: 4Fe-4S binding protein [Cellulosilyticum sp.]|nr:4Fe-4S binding protein [Cellulosilyticum sp.]
MKTYQTTCVYFSATGTTKRSVVEMARILDESYEEMDLTICNEAIQESRFGKNDFVIFGAPVYSGRIYEGAIKRFKKIVGEQTPCLIVVAYGNRDFDDALIELYDLAKTQGFIPIGGAAVVAEHTYGAIQVGRPNEVDLEEDRKFAECIKQKLMRKELAEVPMPGNRPYRVGGKGGSFRPTTTNECIECGLCSTLCPEQAILKENPRILDDGKCISCFRCIRQCPAKAKVVETQEYQTFVKDFNIRLAQRKENLYILN